MKISWGSGIAIFYSLFVIVMLFMVIKSSQNNPHMVQDNYYEKDLNYEVFRQKRQNGEILKDSITIKYQASTHSIFIHFANSISEVKGNVLLFRPSNQYLDQKYKLELDNNQEMIIPLEDQTRKGKWKIQIDWSDGTKDLYIEEIIII